MKRSETKGTKKSNEGISTTAGPQQEKKSLMNVKTARTLADSRDVNHGRDAHNGINSMMSTTAGPQ
jgi:hypothetical protein